MRPATLTRLVGFAAISATAFFVTSGGAAVGVGFVITRRSRRVTQA